MTQLSGTNYKSKIFEKFFESYPESQRANFENLKSVIKFISYLKDKNWIDNKQVDQLIRYSCYIYLEKELDRQIEKSLSRAWSKVFSGNISEEEMEI